MAPTRPRAPRTAGPDRGATPLMQRVRSGALSLAVQYENLEDKIYARLRSLIVDRQILPGERIPVDDLAREMGVSRTPVLNALKRLAQERVVTFSPRRGIYVRRFTKWEMASLFAVREVLEGLAARLATRRIEPAEVERLAASFQGFGSDLSPTRIRQYIQRDRAFHSRLVELAGNEQLTAAMNSVQMTFFAYQDGLVRLPAETIPEHQAILRGLRGRDPEATETAMRLHLRRSMERLEKEASQEELAGAAPDRVGGRVHSERR